MPLTETDVRKEKLARLYDENIDPYPARVERTHTLQEVITNFSSLGEERLFVVGRVRALREHGGSIFVDLEDGTARVQVYIKEDGVGEQFFSFFTNYIDIGDFIEIAGTAFVTKKGQQSLMASGGRLLAKALRPLPEKWHGLKDVEVRLRKRYLDLLANSEVSKLFVQRAKMITAMRSFMDEHGFLEVETPILEHTPGGADALPFITHHNALDVDFYLRISLELHLKRLLVGGYERIYEVGKVFRNEGIDREHLQEFTEMEFYWAYQDYNGLMLFIEKLYTHMLKVVFERDYIEVEGERLDFNGPWQKIDYFDLFKENTGIDLSAITDSTILRKEVEKLSLHDIDMSVGDGRLIDQVYKRLCRPHIKGPAFLINHPLSISPLAKKKSGSPLQVERFQVLIAGSEVGNAFSELNDPLDQRARFEEQMKLRDKGDSEAQMLDEDFLEALEYGMPPAAGFGVGIDRLFMLYAGVSSIRETVLFPQMR